jgi:hypothetical protein
MAAKQVFMATTGISATKTVGEIVAVLVRSGARQVSQVFDGEGRIMGLSFTIMVDGHAIPYSLPARVEAVKKALMRNDLATRKRGFPDEEKIAKQCYDVAWRQLLRWVEAQMAMIDSGMVEPSEVFMPYALAPNGQTLFQHFKANGLKQLAAGE